MLTLSNGERLNLPPDVRIMLEVEHLHYTTLSSVPLDADDSATEMPGRRAEILTAETPETANLVTQAQVASILQRYFADDDLNSALEFAQFVNTG